MTGSPPPSSSKPAGAAPPLRSVLFAPASRPDLMLKLPRARPDAAVLDLEDAVPATPEAKAAARRALAETWPELRAAAPDLRVFVRVNPLHSPFFAADLESLTPDLSGVMLPKLERAGDVRSALEALRGRGRGLSLPLFAGLETGAGVWNAREILDFPEVRWAYFGAEDYTADLGGLRTPGGLEVLYARSQVALAARLSGTLALDIVVTALGDPAAFLADAEQGRALGYSGKLCIHPAQVPLAAQVFGASEAEIGRAQRLLAAAEEAEARGQGAFSFEGQMIDEPLLVRARALLAARAGDAGRDPGA